MYVCGKVVWLWGGHSGSRGLSQCGVSELEWAVQWFLETQ